MTHPRNPRRLLAPAMQHVLERMARLGRAPLHALTPAQARAAYAAAAQVLDVAPHKMAQVSDFTIPARDGHPIPLRLYRPTGVGVPSPVLVYFHGGGFVVGSLDTHDSLCRRLAHLAGGAVLSVDYRLAPEHPFPRSHEDAWDALLWVWQHGGACGLDAGNVAVGGDSAGGTLAAACALQARDAARPLALQLLFYPGCSPDGSEASHRVFGRGFLLESAHIDYFFDHCLPDRAARFDARFAPLVAEDVSGVAPAWLGLAQCDPLVDEGIAYGDKLRAAGVSVDLEVYLGVVHEFIKMGRVLPQALQAHQDAARALRRAWGRPQDPPAHAAEGQTSANSG